MTELNSKSCQITALVLAASRKGVDDPVAKLQDKSHKCLVEIHGTPMIQRVVQTLIDANQFDQIYISIENGQILREIGQIDKWLEDGTLKIIQSRVNLADSLISLANTHKDALPILITAGDNVLHTPDLIRDFVSQFNLIQGDVAIAATREDTVLIDYRNAGLGFFKFRDGGYSFCNLYGLRTLKGMEAAKVFRTGGQFRKRPWRILRVFGILPLIIYKWRLASLDTCMNMIAKKLNISIDKILLDYSYAPIDVDNKKSYDLCEQTLKHREQRI